MWYNVKITAESKSGSKGTGTRELVISESLMVEALKAMWVQPDVILSIVNRQRTVSSIEIRRDNGQ